MRYSYCIHNDGFEEENVDPEPSEDLIGVTIYGGELSQGYLNGTFSKTISGIYYTLTTSSLRGIWSIITSSSYNISLNVYYSDTSSSDPFLTGINHIDYIPTSSMRTTYVLLRNLDLGSAFSFGVAATEITNFSGDYLKYDISNKTMSSCSYVGSVNNLNYLPVGNTTISGSDLGTIDTDGLQPVLTTGSPYDSVAEFAFTHYYDETYYTFYGTAFRIRPNLFASNGHNVFNGSNFSFACSATLYPGMTSYSSSSINVVSYSIPLRYLMATNSFDYDFVLVETTSDTSTDSLGINASISLSENDNIYMLGYPTHTQHNYTQQYSSGQIYEISSTFPTMLTTIPAEGDVYAGSSGSPIFKNGYVVGINNGSVTFYINNVKIACYEHAIIFDTEIQSFVVSVLLSMI